MIRTKPLLFLAFLFTLAFGHMYGQNYNKSSQFLKANSIWTFADSFGINFNNPSSLQFKTGFDVGAEGSATLSDPQTGQLLFYSNGGTCWNKNHVAMPNGKNLLGNGGSHDYNRYSTAQGVCIVPVIGESGKYYLFSLSQPDSFYTKKNDPSRLYYSIVDMSLNNGLGDIVAGKKNILLESSLLSEGMIAVPGNNCDIWLVIHARGSAVFKSYHITAEGINTTPKLSATGSQIYGSTSVALGVPYYFDAYSQVSIKVSPDRTKIAITGGDIFNSGFPFPALSATGHSVGTLLCDFDASTGLVANAMLVDTFDGYDVAFSPDNSKLYIASGVHANQQIGVYQLDISNRDSAAIVRSKTTIMAPTGMLNMSSIKLYNDTIYVNRAAANANMIDRINKPNLAGTACNYQQRAIALTKTVTALPNEVVFTMPPESGNRKVLDTVVCSGWNEGVTIGTKVPGDGYTYEWNTGSKDTALKVTAKGVYWVKYNNGCHYHVDTFVLSGSDLDPVITINVFTLGTTQPFATYQWMLDGQLIAGATSKDYTVTQNGEYRVIVSDHECVDTSEVYLVSNVSIGGMPSAAQQIRIFPNPAQDVLFIQSSAKVQANLTSMTGKSLRKVSNAQQMDIRELAAGIYLLHITDSNGALLKVEKIVKQ